MKRQLRKRTFTLVEVIAVLVIIGILAAVAAPKFINMAEDARKSAAQGGINECKATLSVAYAKAFLAADGVTPTVAQVMSQAGLTSGTAVDFGDINLTPTVSGNNVDIGANSVDGTSVTGVTDTWNLPTQTP